MPVQCSGSGIVVYNVKPVNDNVNVAMPINDPSRDGGQTGSTIIIHRHKVSMVQLINTQIGTCVTLESQFTVCLDLGLIYG